MEFLSTDNIRTILDYIKTDLRSNNINLNDDLKYEKIIRKLCKTILTNNPHSSLDELNRIALEKILPFISNTILKTSPQNKISAATAAAADKLQTELIIDTGTSIQSHVVNKSNNYWEKFAFTLANVLPITQPTDIFLTSICICNPASPEKCLYFTIHIEEFKQTANSNNPALYNKIVIPNTTSPDNNAPFILNVNSYYVSTLYSTKLTVLNINVKDQDDMGSIFKNDSSQNRLILSFALRPRIYY
jgi:hypothetical protein